MRWIRTLLVLAAFVGSAQAAVVQLDVLGIVTSVVPETAGYPHPTPFDLISPGEAIRAVASYDTDMFGWWIGHSPEPGYLGRMTMAAGSWSAWSYITARFDQPTGHASFTVDPSGPYYPIEAYSLDLFFDPNTFGGGASPSFADLSHFLHGSIYGDYALNGDFITSASFHATVSQVSHLPVPGALWLFAGGLAAVAVRSRCRAP